MSFGNDDRHHQCIHSSLSAKPYVAARQASAKRQARKPQSLRVLFDTRYVNDEITCRNEQQSSLDQLAYESLGTSAPRITCAAADVLTVAKAELLSAVLAEASRYLSDTFAVVAPVDGALKLTFAEPIADDVERNGTATQAQAQAQAPTLLCNRPGLTVPSEYVSNGVAGVDLVIFVTTWPVVGGVRGYAEPCQFDASTRRPIAGYINLNPAKLDSLVLTFPTVVHELFHVIGFKASVFPRFVNDFLTPALNLADPAVPLLQSPRVLERARIHFNCSDLQGVPMEPIADHWKKTVLGDELMTATLAPRFPPLSYLTLAALEDSGWYAVDYRRASTFAFGRKRGCEFVTGNCESRIIDGYTPCGSLATACAFDQRSYGACPDDSELLGACVLPATTVSCLDGGPTSAADTIGPDARCFGVGKQAQCLLMRCEGPNDLRVTFQGQSYTCVGDTPRIIRLANGAELSCPAATDLCGCACQNGGVCLRGRCVCRSGFDGGSCELTLPPFDIVRAASPAVALTPRFPIVSTITVGTLGTAPAPSTGALPLVPIIAGAGGAAVLLICVVLFLMLFLRTQRLKRAAARKRANLSVNNHPDTFAPASPGRGSRQRAEASAIPMVHVAPQPRWGVREPVTRSKSRGPPVINRASKHHGVSARHSAIDDAHGVPVLFDAVAVWDCHPDEPDELAFQAGDVLGVVDDSDENWWLCVLRGTYGNCPSAFLDIPQR
jgi:hypothetical protein